MIDKQGEIQIYQMELITNNNTKSIDNNGNELLNKPMFPVVKTGMRSYRLTNAKCLNLKGESYKESIWKKRLRKPTPVILLLQNYELSPIYAQMFREDTIVIRAEKMILD